MHENLPLNELRKLWAQHWSLSPHKGIGRVMLTRSLEYKIMEQKTGGLSPEHKAKLDGLIKQYKRNSNCFDKDQNLLKPGMRLVRSFKGRKHSVLVNNYGFEYNDKIYSSLSQIASDITGSRWNGWVFFGLKKVERIL